MVTIAQLDILLRAPLSALNKDFNNAVSATRQLGSNLSQVGRTLTAGVTLPLAAVGAGAFKAATDFETAMAGVAKTVDATDSQIQRLGDSFIELSERIPISARELANLGQIAGQLGIQVPNIAKFVETAAQLGVATNLSAQDAAQGLARLAKTTQTSQGDIDRLGASLVALGNVAATNEGEILELAQRISGTATAIGLTQGEVLGFAAALREVGIEAQLGGTAVQRLLIQLQAAVAEGGTALTQFANVAGIEVGKFQKLFAVDAADAVASFIEGLGKLSGADLFRTLSQLGIQEQRLIQVLVNASRAGDNLRRRLERGNKAFEENSALVQEAARFFGTTTNQIKLFANSVTNLAAELGRALIPSATKVLNILKTLLDVAVKPLIQTFEDLPGPIQTVVVAVLALAAAVGPLSFVFGGAITGLASFAAALKSLSTLLGGTALLSNLSNLKFLLGVGGIGGALVAATFFFGKYIAETQRMGEDTRLATERVRGLVRAVRELSEEEIRLELGRSEIAITRLQAEASALEAQLSDVQMVSSEIAGIPVQVPAGPVSAADLEAATRLRDVQVELNAQLRQQAALRKQLTTVAAEPVTIDPTPASELAEFLREVEARLAQIPARAEALGAAFDPLSERAAILGAAINKLFDDFADVPGAADAIADLATRLGSASDAVERFREGTRFFDSLEARIAELNGTVEEQRKGFDQLALSIILARDGFFAYLAALERLNDETEKVAQQGIDFRSIGEQAGAGFIRAFTTEISNAGSAIIAVFRSIFNRVADIISKILVDAIIKSLASKKVADAIAGVVGGGFSLGSIPVIGTLEKLLPFDIAPVDVRVNPVLDALPDLAPVTVELTPQLSQFAETQQPAFSISGATAVAPAAQFSTIPRDALSPLTIHALARDPVVQSISREIALVAVEDGF